MKNNLNFLLLLLYSFIPLSLSGQQKGLIVSELQCESLNNPIAIDNAAPLLSWRFKTNLKTRGKSQKAYHILVSDSPSSLKEGMANLWDSGIIKSSESTQIIYKGKPLASRQKAYWKVRVYDEDNYLSSWSKTATWSMGLLKPSDWSAHWIAHQDDTYPDSVMTYPAPYFRKEFSIEKPVRQAKVYMCGLGFYEMSLNGKKVGDQVLAPAITNYDKRIIRKILYEYDDQSTQRILYNTFEITTLLKKGENTIGVILGNGWYNQRDRTVEGRLWYNTPRMIIQIEIKYADGSTQIVKTDKSWKSTTGPLLHDAIFTGEKYDARKELANWNRNDYDDTTWGSSLEEKAPAGKLQSQLAPYDKIIRTIKPVYKGKENDSTYIYTLLEMVSGWAELKVQGKAGSRIKLQFVSEEEKDFGQMDQYILKGGVRVEKWEPRFTWHAFRTIKVTSPEVKMNRNSLLVKVAHTKMSRTGNFSCSNKLFNKINDAYIRTQEANFHGSISSDCPHRERLGYTGDAQVLGESSLFTYNMAQFYRKWFNDMEDARNKKTGYVPHTAPFAGGGGGPAWGSAFVIMPWSYYCHYGDKTILEQHYNGMKQWVEYLGNHTDENGIIVREEPNGWCLGDWCTPEKVQIPESLVNTAYYYHTAGLMSKVSTILGKEKDVAYFTQLTTQIKANFNQRFYNVQTSHYWEGRQGSDVIALAFGLVPEEKKQEVFNSLLKHLKDIDYHFDTGILTTPLLLNVLSDYGRTDLAYKIMNQRTEPGFSYLLNSQYSSLWETWDGKESRCHPMFGSVVAWFYHSLAGINFDESETGMKHINIAPQPVDELKYSNASYRSQYGLIRSNWHFDNDKNFRLTVEIPANTTATIYLPNKNNHFITESKIPIERAKGVLLIENKNGKSIIGIGSGIYYFAVSNNDK